MEKFYKSAKAGGYDFDRLGNPKSVIERDNALLLDPEAWICCGKAEEWDTTTAYCPCCRTDRHWQGLELYKRWQYYMHRFIDHIAEGKSIDDFFNNLIK